MASISAVYRLGLKEFRSLWRDRAMTLLIVWAFSLGIYGAARAIPDTLHHAPIAIVDEDHSALSAQLADAFQRPYFRLPASLPLDALDRAMDEGRYTFVLDIGPDFQRDVLAGRRPSVQLNVDATQIGQAFSGAAHIQDIFNTQVGDFVRRYQVTPDPAVSLALRVAFNPNLTQAWFTAVMELVNYITMVSIILTGAALIREREHGTIEHLLVMPLRPLEIMLAKVWSMGSVVLVASGLSVVALIHGVIGMPITGSIPLFLAATAIHLFATTAMGIYLGTVTRSMPQLGLMSILVLLPLQMLSGGITPRESMPRAVQYLMELAPTTHFVSIAQSVLYRGAGVALIWPHLLAILAIGGVAFGTALLRFRKDITRMG
jgi:ABC-2 type transport system permease protein